ELTCITHGAAPLPLSYGLTLARLDLRDVRVERVVLVSVVHDDQVPIPLEPPRIDDVARVHRGDFPTHRCLDVDAIPESPGPESRVHLHTEPPDGPPLGRPGQAALVAHAPVRGG